jgi:hypothetical protein
MLLSCTHFLSVKNGHKESAFILAENYRDFASLASLCHKETVYPPHENPNADRIHHYIERFKGEFAAELFRWYIDHGLSFCIVGRLHVVNWLLCL